VDVVVNWSTVTGMFANDTYLLHVDNKKTNRHARVYLITEPVRKWEALK
jgi:hypothetical protein